MTINILLCDTFPGILGEKDITYSEMFIDAFSQAGRCHQYRVHSTWRGELPSIGSDEVYVITGSTSSAYDSDTWIVKLKEWIVEAARKEAMLVGICFGHQVIAQALGGLVERSPKGWGVGFRESAVVDSTAREAIGDTLSLLYNHHDQVVRLPNGALRIATSDFCPNEGFRIGTRLFTLQGHPEFPVDFERKWITGFAPGEPEQLKARALASLDTGRNDAKAVVQWILGSLD